MHQQAHIHTNLQSAEFLQGRNTMAKQMFTCKWYDTEGALESVISTHVNVTAVTCSTQSVVGTELLG